MKPKNELPQSSEKKEDKIILKATNKGHVTLPFDEDNFAEFVIGLLGKPQSISKTYSGEFLINMDDILNFHYLITQRISQQNNGTLIQVRATISFDDNSSVTLNSFDELVTYNEIRKLISTSINISWQFLLQFQDKKVPERQEIDLTIIASGGKEKSFDDQPFQYTYDNDDIVYHGGYINFLIKHTARTWGADIEAMLSGHIEGYVKERTKTKKWVWENSEEIGFFSGLLFFLSILIGSIYRNYEYKKGVQEYIAKNISSSGEKISYLMDNIEHYYHNILFILVSMIFAYIFMKWVERKANTSYYSFLLLTKESKNSKDKKTKESNKEWSMFFASLITGVISSLIANWVLLFI